MTRSKQVSANELLSRSTPESSVQRRSPLKRGGIVAGLALTAGVLAGCSHEDNAKHFEDAGFTPSPSVSSAGTEALIGLNDALRDYGPYGLGVGAIAGLSYEVIRRRPDSRLGAMHDATHQTSRMNRVIFTGVVMGITASASGLGDTASTGANKPVEAMAEMLGADTTLTPIITGYGNTPYNTSVINFDNVQQIIHESGGVAVPFLQNLGEVKNPDAESNPSSAPIFAVPNTVLEKSLDISLPEISDCKNMSVIVGEQLNVSKGDTVTINDLPATVAKTVDMKPGLDRVAVIGSLEQMSQCVYPDQPMTGAVALSLDGKHAELQNLINSELKTPYSVRSFEEFQEKYQEFWDRSVKPPEMNLILNVLLLGGIALGAMQTSEILSRRKNIAMLLSQGVEPKHISQAYGLTAQRDTLLAIPVGIGAESVFTSLNNSSQFGLAEAVNVSSLGAAYTTLAAVAAASSAFANRSIKKTNVAEQLRSSV